MNLEDMEIFVCETSYSNAMTPSIVLFTTERSAYEHALREANSQMLLWCWNESDNDGHEFYESFHKLWADDNLSHALDKFNAAQNWLHTNSNDDVVHIRVYSRFLHFSEGESTNKVPNVTKKLKLADVPCKQCGRNVNASESTCWNCGIMAPAN